MIETHLIESVLSALFDSLEKKIIVSPSDRAKLDFVIEEDGKRIGIEVKPQNVKSGILKNLISTLNEFPDLDEFYLITPDEPNEFTITRSQEFFKKSKVKIHWLSINQFIQNQKLDIQLTEDLKSTLIDLQIAAITSKFETYEKNFIGNDLPSEHLKKNFKNVKDGKIDKSNILYEFRRQFPYSTIKKLEDNQERLEEILSFGKKYDDAIIVLTDIKSFSNLVSVSDPDDLNDLMSKYYTNARDLVFKNGGILDKFIGDAVLAIFNYPFKDPSSFTNALKFCSELILMGNNILNEFQKKLDQKIETGTRIGVSTGTIYPLNISTDEYDVTFIGDKINLAARLEKNSEVNGILLSNRFYHQLSDTNSDLITQVTFEELLIDPKDAKGQMEPITAWKINKTEIEKII